MTRDSDKFFGGLFVGLTIGTFLVFIITINLIRMSPESIERANKLCAGLGSTPAWYESGTSVKCKSELKN